MSHLHFDKKIINRINRLQGQVNALQKMAAETETDCMAVLQQAAAIKGAVSGLMGELIEEQLTQHVLGDNYNAEELAVFLQLLKKYQ